MLSCNCVMFDFFLIFDTCYFENSQHSLQMPDKQLPAVRKPQNHNVCKIQGFSIFVNLLEFHISSRIKSNVMKYHHYFSEKIVYFYRRFQLSSNQYLYRSIIFQNIVELIKHSFIILLCKFLSSLLFIFNGDRLLSFLSWQFLSLFSLFHFKLVFYDISFVMYFYSFLFIFYFIRFFLVCLCKFLN